MTQNEKDLLLQDICSRLPYGVKVQLSYKIPLKLLSIGVNGSAWVTGDKGYPFEIDWSNCKPYLFPMSSMTEEDHAIYSKIWEDTGKTAYLEGCHHLISTIKAYKAANDFLLSKHYDINGLIPKDLAIDATGLNIY